MYVDLGEKDADVKQTKTLLAAEIIRILDKEKLSVRAAEKVTGYNYSDFSRICSAELSRFTIDKLMMITNALSRRVNVKISVTKKRGVSLARHLIFGPPSFANLTRDQLTKRKKSYAKPR